MFKGVIKDNVMQRLKPGSSEPTNDNETPRDQEQEAIIILRQGYKEMVCYWCVIGT